MRAFNNHFGMVVATVVAITLSLAMSTFAVFLDHLTWSIPLAIRNWGTCYLIITLTGWIFPLTQWAFVICEKLNIKKGTFLHGIVENIVASLFFNTTATFILSAVNIFGNPAIEEMAELGIIPSVQSFWLSTALHDWPITFVFSFVIALIITNVAIDIAKKAAKINFDNEYMIQNGLGVVTANRPANSFTDEKETHE